MCHSRNLVLLLAATFLPTMTSADRPHRVSATTGNDLLEYCESKERPFPTGLCLGYVLGAGDVESTEGASFPDRERSCVPDDVTNGQMVGVVVKYLKDHPEERRMLAAVLVVEAMTKAFPCSSK